MRKMRFRGYVWGQNPHGKSSDAEFLKVCFFQDAFSCFADIKSPLYSPDLLEYFKKIVCFTKRSRLYLDKYFEQKIFLRLQYRILKSTQIYFEILNIYIFVMTILDSLPKVIFTGV